MPRPATAARQPANEFGFPADIPGLCGRYVADRCGAGYGSTVGAWPDASGHGRTLRRTAGTVTYEAGVLNGRGVVRVVSGATLSASNWTDSLFGTTGCIVGVMKVTSAGAEPLWDNSANLWLNTAATTPQGWTLQNTGAVINRDPTTPNGHHYFHAFWEPQSSPSNYPATTGTIQVGINFRDVQAINGSSLSAAGRAMELPRSGGMEYAEVCFFNRRPTWLELFRLNRYFAARYGTPDIDALTGCVCYLGNSTTQALPHYSDPDLVTRNAAVLNFGISGGSITTMNAQRVELLEVLNYFRARGKKGVVYCHHGHNNAYGGTTNTATNSVVQHFTGADGSTLFADIRATGAKLLLITPSIWAGWASLGVPHTGGTDETYRQALRTWMNSTAVSGGYADAVYDLGGTAQFGVYGEGATPTAGTSHGDYPANWADNVHQTAAGETAKAALIASAVQSIYDAA